MVACLALLLSFATAPAFAATASVQYLGANGSLQSAVTATILTGGGATTIGTAGSSTFYVCQSGTLSYSGTLTISGSVTLILADGCNMTVTAASITQGNGSNAGINVTGTNSLTITAQSTGASVGILTATGGSATQQIVATGAGIGGSGVFSTGTGTATGGACGTVIINGGTVNATGGNGVTPDNGSASGAGIGGGGANSNNSNGGNATGGAGGTITINGGTVNATGGNVGSGSGGGAGIGGGGSIAVSLASNVFGGAGGTITINGGTVNANGNHGGAGIGGGVASDAAGGDATGGASATVAINGGTVTANGGSGGAGIGSGYSYSQFAAVQPAFGSINVIIAASASVTATGAVSIGTATSTNAGQSSPTTAGQSATLYNLTVTASTGGTVSPALSGSPWQMTSAASLPLTFTPNAGYVVSDVTSTPSRGVITDLGALTSYTVSNLSQNTSIAVFFGMLPPLSSSNTVTITNNGSPWTTNPVVGQTLTATTSITDSTPGALTYQWYRNGTTPIGTNSNTYTAVAADAGQSIIVTVSAANYSGSLISGTVTVAPYLSSSDSVTITNNGSPWTTNPVVGNTLTATPSFAESASTLGTLTYHWYRNGTTSIGTSSATYTAVAADAGQSITVTVSAANYSGSLTSGAQPVAVNLAGTISISSSGTPATVGSVLTAVTTGITSVTPLGQLTYQWLQNGTAIGGANSATYTAATADTGQQITVQVSAANYSGSLTSNGLPIASNLAGTVTITVNATPTVVGNTLTAKTSGITSTSLGTLTYQWSRNGAAIVGATGSTYLTVAADAGQPITVTVYAANYFGSLLSAAVTVAPYLSASDLVTITNNGSPWTTNPVVGNTLTATATFAETTPGTLTYQWYRNGTTTIGTNSATYTTVTADGNQSITVQVSAANYSGSLTSAPQPVVMTSVPYLDANGNTQTTNATILAGSESTLDSSTDPNGGVFVCQSSTLSYGNTLTINGTVTLILADGCNMSVTGVTVGNGVGTAGIDVEGSNSLTITAQSTGANMGTLTATGSGAFYYAIINSNQLPYGSAAGIGSGVNSGSTTTGAITINGGKVSANGGPSANASGAGIGGGGASTTYATPTGVAGGKLTINGGTVNATGGSGSNGGGAGIGGGGAYGSSAVGGAVGAVIISARATVTATGGSGSQPGANIGSGGRTSSAGTSATLYNLAVTVSPSAGGTVSPALSGSPWQMTTTASLPLTFTPNAGYGVPDVTSTPSGGATTDLGALTSYTVSNLSQATGIVVTFGMLPPLSSSDSVTITNNGSPWTTTPVVGQTLTATTSFAESTPGALTYQWYQNGTTPIGTNSATYTTTTADAGQSITVQVSAANYSGSLTSGAQPVAANLAGTVSISSSGTPTVVGNVLTAVTTGIISTSPGTFSYQWYQGSTAISGATNSTYTAATADAGQSITVQVSAANYSGSLTSGAQPVAANLAGAITISYVGNGTSPVVGNVLTAVTTGITSTSPGTLTYQWYQNGTAISGATNNTYTAATADAGQSITVTVSAANYSGSLTSGAQQIAANLAGSVSISSSVTPATVGSVLTAVTTNITSAAPLGTLTYQWYRGGTAISGATNSTYTAATADAGQSITVQVSAANYSGSLTSGAQPVAANLAGTVSISSSGTPTVVGNVLTAVTTSITSTSPGTFSYQWYQGSTAISGATNSTYTTVAADAGQSITVQVSAANYSGSLTSGAQQIAANLAGTISISFVGNGTSPVVGNVLTAVTTSITSTSPGTLSYQWYRGSTAISGTNSSTYTAATADAGQSITVQVSAANYSGSLTSSAQQIVANLAGSVSITSSSTPPTVGSTLTADTSGLTSTAPLGQFSYQWLQNGTEISGATNATYTPGTADADQSISVMVSAANYTGSITSAELTVVSAALSQAIADVNGLPSPVTTWADANLVATATNAVSSLSAANIALLPDYLTVDSATSIPTALTTAQQQAGPVNHTDAAVTATASASVLPWNVRLIATPIAPTDPRYAEIVGQLPASAQQSMVLWLDDITLLDTLTGNTTEPVGGTVTIDLSLPSGWTNLALFHQPAPNGPLESVAETESGNVLTFNATSFSPYVLTGDLPPVPIDARWMLALLGALLVGAGAMGLRRVGAGLVPAR